MLYAKKCNSNHRVFDGFTNKFFGEFDSIFNDLTQEFDQNFGHKMDHVPAVNVYENDHEFRLDISAAGLSREAFQIKLDQDNLVISAERPEKPEGDKFIRKEFGFGHFRRSFVLPENIDKEQIKAEYTHGILHVHLPKSTMREARDIEIS